LQRLSRPDRVELFEIEPVPISSQGIRDRVRRGESIDGLVPLAVAELIEVLGLYRNGG
jgi:nicotinic acid mononucleotide adenylyltransferase